LNTAYAQTVLGKIPSEKLGVTLSHEHLIVKPNNSDSYYEQYTLDDAGKSTEETISFKQSGGNTIVEMTPINYGRNPLLLKKISENAGIHIICTTGFHEEKFLPNWIFSMDDDSIKQKLLNEINIGIDGTTIKPGVLKIGTSLNKVTETEKRLIRIVSDVHKETGLPISTHCSKGTKAIEQARFFLENGVDPSRVIIGHVDIPNDIELLIELCRLGFNVQIDHVGRDLANNDATKVKLIVDVINAGYINQVFLSGDMGKKGYLPAYGGTPGLSYFLKDLKGELMKKISEEDYYHILKINPRRFFTITTRVNE